MAALGCGELEPRDDAPGLGGVVVRDRRLEPLAQRLGLAKLSAQPAEEADARRALHRRQSPHRLSALGDEPEPLVEPDRAGRVARRRPSARRARSPRRANSASPVATSAAPSPAAALACSRTARSFSQPLDQWSAQPTSVSVALGEPPDVGSNSGSPVIQLDPVGVRRSARTADPRRRTPRRAAAWTALGVALAERADRDPVGHRRHPLDARAERAPHHERLVLGARTGAARRGARAGRRAEATVTANAVVPAQARPHRDPLEQLVGERRRGAASASSPRGLTAA